ncbi:MAG: GAF domain-containing sensor histidine kinase [Chloroflexota bacterium]
MSHLDKQASLVNQAQVYIRTFQSRLLVTLGVTSLLIIGFIFALNALSILSIAAEGWLWVGGGIILLQACLFGASSYFAKQTLPIAKPGAPLHTSKAQLAPIKPTPKTATSHSLEIKSSAESSNTGSRSPQSNPETINELQRENKRLQQKLSDQKAVEVDIAQRNFELMILQSAGIAMTSSLDLRYVLDTVVQEMTKLLSIESCTISEWDQTGNRITRIAKFDAAGWWDPDSSTEARNLADYPVTQSVLSEKIPEQMKISQALIDPAERRYMEEIHIKTRMILPMIFQERVVGLVELEDSQIERTFTNQEITLTRLLASQAASAMENAKLFSQAQQEIKERQQAEAALEEERALLADRVAERTEELSKANAQLARAARLKDEFLANTSHELRTPLNTILGSSEILQTEAFGEVNERQIKYLRNINESGQHLLDLINDILDLSKAEAGKLELEIAPTSVLSLCQSTIRLVKQLAHKKRLTLRETIDETVTVMVADERRLKQVLVNLLSNAIKFTPEGGEIGLDVEGDSEAQVIHFTVWDTGIGLASEDMVDLFKPFIQVQTGRHHKREGTGLGLSLVSRMVELHGGSVSVESEVGVGSRFKISLPWTQAMAQTEKDGKVPQS